MSGYQKSVVPKIESRYDNFTATEKIIADFFICNHTDIDFSAKEISRRLHVSSAALVRFAKKLEFSGYREFIYQYRAGLVVREEAPRDILNVWDAYQEVLNRSYNLMDTSQVKRVAALMSQKERIYLYGVGSSGLAAQELESRFMRVGMDVYAVTDTHLMAMNHVRLDPNCLVIAISVSGETREVMNALQAAARAGAVTVLITSRNHTEFQNLFDEVLPIAVKKRMDSGEAVSPQLPVLILGDVLYTYFVQQDQDRTQELYRLTLHAILNKDR